MRSLTDAEARVIAVLLASLPSSETERLHRMGVPRSTYHAARRRAYAEGWLFDRYVPDPGRFGFGGVTFLLARTYADRVGEMLQTWDRTPGNVVALGSAQMALGVFFHDGAAPAASILKSVAPPNAGWGYSITAVPERASVPAYFDYEGPWVHLGGASGALAYPQGLGGPSTDGGARREVPPPLARSSWATVELIHRPFALESMGRGGHLVGPLGLPWSQQRLLKSGAVRHRVLLQPGGIPPYSGRGIDQLVFITGSLQPGARPEELFASLTQESRVFPFLYVTDDSRVLLGALGRGSSDGVPPEESTGRRSAMEVLRSGLTNIEILQESVSRIQFVANHRYDRLFARVPPK